jgi:hypothetical protein
MSTPANKELKALRIKAHRLCEDIFGKWESIGKEGKKPMYAWLAKNTSKGHIGLLDEQELAILIKKLEIYGK